MKAKFVDYKPGHARKHAGTLDPAADARLFAEPDPIDESPERLERLRKRISEVKSATCNAYAVIGLPLKLRPLVDAILAASEGSTHFQASQKVLVELLFRQGDGRTYNAKRWQVRGMLKALTRWQVEKKITLCTIRPGGKTKDEEGEDEYHTTEFDLVFLDAVAKAMMRDPQPDRMRSAVQVEISEMMKLPPFDGRWRAKQPTPRQIQERNKKAAMTKAIKAAVAELTMPAGGDPVAYAEQFCAEFKQNLLMELERRANAPLTSYQEGVSEKLSDEAAEVASQGVGGIPPTPPAPSVESESASSQARSGAEIAPKDKEYKVLISEDLPTPDVEPSPAAKAVWRDLERRLRAPDVQVRTVEVATSGDRTSAAARDGPSG